LKEVDGTGADKGWKFRLYVTGDAPQSKQALANLEALCRHYLEGQYQVEVVDLLREPQRYLRDEILVTPTLVRYAPEPVCTLIGNLSNSQEVLLALGLKER
jgi:circadian clock protein KaiB